MRPELALAGALASMLAGVGLAAVDAHAEPIALPRLHAPVVVDGVLDEAAWANIDVLPTGVYEPTYGAAPSERTEIRIGHDERGLYVAAHLYDSRPDDVRDNSLYRDLYAGDDTVGIIVDAFNDDDTALWFYTTPAGVRVDGTVAADMASGDPDWSWNGHWEAAARRTADGWTAEMWIPFTTLGFRGDGRQVIMGISAYRWLARHGERHIWPDVPPAWPRAYAKPSRLADVRMEGVSGRRAVYITPYALGGYRWPSPAVAGTDASMDNGDTGADYELGLDIKYSASSSLTVDATLNTDFAQVEADDEQINLTRFPLFFAEKRQFFLERASVFDVAFLGDGRLFHSRRIGLVDGRPVRILGGARVVARAGRWDIGALDMLTAASEREGVRWPGENMAVLRVRRQVIDPLSNLGAMLTTRAAGDGRYNLAYGLDGNIHVTGDEHLVLRLAQSLRSAQPLTSEPEQVQPWRGERLLVRWQRRRLAGLSYDAAVGWASAGFEPGLGFEPRTDVGSVGETIGYRWLLGPSSLLRSVALAGAGELFVHNSSRTVDSAISSPTVSVVSRGGHELSLATIHRYEDVIEPFTIADTVTVPVGSYGFHRVRAALGISSSQRLHATLALEGGGLYGGRSLSLRVAPTWNVSRHINMSGEYELDMIRPAGAPALDAHVGRLRLQLALDTHASMSALMQYSSLTGRLSINGRVRYHLREGNDIWLVYDDTAGLGAAASASPGEVGRTVLVKYTHTFVR